MEKIVPKVQKTNPSVAALGEKVIKQQHPQPV